MPDSAPERLSGARKPLRLGRSGDSGERTVAIIGAGFSGTLAAINLRRTLPGDHVVHLFERSGRFARGPAYAGGQAAHLLNVRCSNMSALPDDPGHFERWLDEQDPAPCDEMCSSEAGRFATRRLYGRYLRALLFDEMLQSGGRVLLCADEVTRMIRRPEGWDLLCTSGRVVSAAAVVIAAGNLPSQRVVGEIVFHDPWRPEAVANLRPGEPVLVVGTGLSMVDLAVAMTAHGFRGPIVALSRRGLVPQRHGAPGTPWRWAPFTSDDKLSLTRMLRRVRDAVTRAAYEGHDWRAVVDGLRPLTASLWQDLPVDERNRFLRHLRPFWDVHRHRMAPKVADDFAALLQNGALTLRRGRVKEITLRDEGALVTLQNRGADRCDTLAVQRVIYATGTGAGLAESPLVAGLRDARFARSDPHGLGLDVDERLRVLGPDSRPTPGLWALGPIVRGVFWECTAVPDIRIQGRVIGQEIAGALAKLA